MAAGNCEFLNLMVDQATAAPIRQPRTKVTDLSFEAPDEEITRSTSTNQESHLPRLVKTKLRRAPMRRDPQVGNLENKAALPQDWRSMVGLSLVETKALKEDNMKLFSKCNDLWSGCPRLLMLHIIQLTRSNLYDLYSNSPKNNLERCFVSN